MSRKRFPSPNNIGPYEDVIPTPVPCSGHPYLDDGYDTIFERVEDIVDETDLDAHDECVGPFSD